jgi:hypothetical protein
MSDVDILVEKDRLKDSVAVLSKLGYVSLYGDEPFYREHHHIQPYKKKDSFAVIEVHHNIVSEPLISLIDTDCLWEDTQNLELGGINTLVLSAENLLLHLCMHLSTHTFISGMRILVDISESLTHYKDSLDWDLFVKRSNEFGVGSSVYYPLWLAKEMMNADIPANVLGDLKVEPKLSYPEARLLRTIIRRSIFRTESHGSLASRFITILYKSICGELLWTPGIGKRIKRAGDDWLYGLKKLYHEYVKKDYKLRPIRMRTVGKKKRNND